MSPENWEEGGAEGQAALVAPPPKALHLEDWFWMRGKGDGCKELERRQRRI
jgi:hypothetical protein